MTYQLVNNNANVALRKGGNTLFPRHEGTYPAIPTSVLTPAGYIVSGTIIKGDRIDILAANVTHPINGVVGYKGDKWLHVTSIGGFAVDGFTAVVHKGANQGTLTDIPDAPAETAAPPKSCVWTPEEPGHPLHGRKFLYEFVKEL